MTNSWTVCGRACALLLAMILASCSGGCASRSGYEVHEVPAIPVPVLSSVAPTLPAPVDPGENARAGWPPRFEPEVLVDVSGSRPSGEVRRIPRAIIMHRLDVERLLAEEVACRQAGARCDACEGQLAVASAEVQAISDSRLVTVVWVGVAALILGGLIGVGTAIGVAQAGR